MLRTDITRTGGSRSWLQDKVSKMPYTAGRSGKQRVDAVDREPWPTTHPAARFFLEEIWVISATTVWAPCRSSPLHLDKRFLDGPRSRSNAMFWAH